MRSIVALAYDATGYGYDRADRITSAGGVSYTVDANGNLVSRGADSFGYDQANRLKTASVGGASSGFVYDGDGKRASKTVGGGDHRLPLRRERQPPGAAR